MTWFSALPFAFVTVAWVLAPGLTITYALGMRGLTAWGAAPVATVTTVATTAVVGGRLGIPWSPFVAACGALVVAAVVLVVRTAVRRMRGRRRAQHPVDWRTAVAAVLGIAGACVAVTVTAIGSMAGPDALSQTYDAVFHYNAVAQIVANGDASSLAVGALTDPTATSAFYPAAWHDMVSLVVETSMASIPLASNLMAFVVAAVIWPLSCTVLVRQVVGRSVAATLITPVLAVGFIAFPWSLMTFGVLWPNLIGLALVPVGLAAVVTVCGLARDTAFTKGQAFVLAGMSVVGLALAHPNTVFSLAVLSVFPFLYWVTATVRGMTGIGRWVAGVAALVVGVGVVAVGLYLAVDSPLFASVRAFDWPAYESPPQAAGEVLLNATNGKDAAWAITVVVVIGIIAAGRSRTTRWLIPAYLASAALFILASALETPLAAALTGLWYNDSYRLAAMIPITAVPMSVVGLVTVGSWAAKKLPAPAEGTTPSPVLRILQPGVLTAAVTAVLVVLSSGMYVRDHADFLSTSYPEAGTNSLLTPPQRAFLQSLKVLVPPDSVVAQNPWTGGALLWALTGRKVLFPHLDGTWTADQRYLADHLNQVATDPRVCSIANDLGVQYLLTGNVTFWTWDGRTHAYPGLDITGPVPGFELVAQDPSGFRLYRITACGPGATATS